MYVGLSTGYHVVIWDIKVVALPAHIADGLDRAWSTSYAYRLFIGIPIIVLFGGKPLSLAAKPEGLASTN